MGDVAKGTNPAAEYKETATADGAEPVCAGGLKHGCHLQVQKAIPTGAPLITDHRSVVTTAMCARDGGILLPISSGGRPEDLPSALVAGWVRPRLTGTAQEDSILRFLFLSNGARMEFLCPSAASLIGRV